MQATTSSVLVVLILFGLIFISLGFGCYFLLTEKASSTKTVRSLTFRISLSLLLFFFLLLAYQQGWLQPHGLGESILMNNMNR